MDALLADLNPVLQLLAVMALFATLPFMFVCIESCRELLPFLCFVCYDYGRGCYVICIFGFSDFSGLFSAE